MKITTNPATPAVTQTAILSPAKPATHTLTLNNRELVFIGALLGRCNGHTPCDALFSAAFRTEGYKAVAALIDARTGKGYSPGCVDINGEQSEFDKLLSEVAL